MHEFWTENISENFSKKNLSCFFLSKSRNGGEFTNLMPEIESRNGEMAGITNSEITKSGDPLYELKSLKLIYTIVFKIEKKCKNLFLIYN